MTFSQTDIRSSGRARNKMLNLSDLFIKARTTLAYNIDDNPLSKLSGTVPIFNIISFDLNIKHAGAMPLHDRYHTTGIILF